MADVRLTAVGGELDRRHGREEHVRENCQLSGWVPGWWGKESLKRGLWKEIRLVREFGVDRVWEPLGCARGEVKWTVRVTVLGFREEVPAGSHS